MNVMQKPGRNLPYDTVLEPCARMIRLCFLVFPYICQEDVAKIFKMPGAPRSVNPAWAITCLVSVTIYCRVFQIVCRERDAGVPHLKMYT